MHFISKQIKHKNKEELILVACNQWMKQKNMFVLDLSNHKTAP